MRADNAEFLVRAATERHNVTVRRAHEAIEALDRSGAGISFCAVARVAGVSRSWLYRDDDVRTTIERLRSRGPAPSTPSAQRASQASLRERLDATRDEITRLRAENAELRERLARSLGAQRARH